MATEEGDLVVVFNGEIYNYKELSDSLPGKFRFRTQSDTEVLLHLYRAEGSNMVRRLRGMFAFAIWDRRDQTLFCARDRFGKKPFYYTWQRGVFAFASEIGALLAGGLPGGQVDRESLDQYLQLLYVPSPRTIFEGITKLSPGHTLTVKEGHLDVRSYWSAPIPGSRERETPDLERLNALLDESVALRLRSDVPVGAFLSGGIDSSVIVARMSKASSKRLKTFSVGFGRPDDELPYAREIARKYSTDHHEILVTRALPDLVTEAVAAYSEPLGDSSVVPTVALCREVASHVKVVLSGDGGDEVFGGYDRYRMIARLPHIAMSRHIAPFVSRIPGRRAQSVSRGLRVVGAEGAERNLRFLEVFPERSRKALGLRPGAPGRGSYPANATDAAIHFDLTTYLPDNLMLKVDIASMRWGLEVRCPLLDQELAEAVIPLKSCYKVNAATNKLLLRQLAREDLPPSILTRRKRGFGSPVEGWLGGPLAEILRDVVTSRRSWVMNELDPRPIRRIVSDVVAGRGNAHQAWALLSLELWSQKHLKCAPRP
jgi:asparagine synthase (glutamine-hydrolysing)